MPIDTLLAANAHRLSPALAAELREAFGALEAELARLRAQQGLPVGYFIKERDSLWSQVAPEYEKDDDVTPLYAAPPAQPAEPVQRLSDADIDHALATTLDALAKQYGIDHAVHVRTDIAEHHTLRRAFARAIESAIQPQWRDIESAPKDGTDVWLHADGKVLRAFWLVKPYRETRDLDGNYIDHQDYDELWMSCADGDTVEDPTEWMPITIPPAPKASHDPR